MFYLLIQMIEGKLHIWSIIFTIPMYITFKKLQVNKQCKIPSFYCYLGVVMFEKRIWLYTRNVYHSVLRTEDSSFVISWKNAIKLSTQKSIFNFYYMLYNTYISYQESNILLPMQVDIIYLIITISIISIYYNLNHLNLFHKFP